MALEIKKRNIKQVPIIEILGQIDMSNYVEAYEALLEEINQKGKGNVILNLKQLSFLDSACLGMLLRCLDKAKKKGGTLAIVTNSFVERVFTVTGLVDLFDTFTTEEQALDYLKTPTS